MNSVNTWYNCCQYNPDASPCAGVLVVRSPFSILDPTVYLVSGVFIRDAHGIEAARVGYIVPQGVLHADRQRFGVYNPITKYLVPNTRTVSSSIKARGKKKRLRAKIQGCLSMTPCHVLLLSTRNMSRTYTYVIYVLHGHEVTRKMADGRWLELSTFET